MCVCMYFVFRLHCNLYLKYNLDPAVSYTDHVCFPSFVAQFLAHFGVLGWVWGCLPSFRNAARAFLEALPGCFMKHTCINPHGVDSPYNGPVVYRQLVNMSDGSHL